MIQYPAFMVFLFSWTEGKTVLYILIPFQRDYYDHIWKEYLCIIDVGLAKDISCLPAANTIFQEKFGFWNTFHDIDNFINTEMFINIDD